MPPAFLAGALVAFFAPALAAFFFAGAFFAPALARDDLAGAFFLPPAFLPAAFLVFALPFAAFLGAAFARVPALFADLDRLFSAAISTSIVDDLVELETEVQSPQQNIVIPKTFCSMLTQ